MSMPTPMPRHPRHWGRGAVLLMAVLLIGFGAGRVAPASLMPSQSPTLLRPAPHVVPLPHTTLPQGRAGDGPIGRARQERTAYGPVLASGPVVVPGNIIANPSFETASGAGVNLFDNWTLKLFTSNLASLSLDTTTPPDGARAAQVTISAPDQTSYHIQLQQTLTITGGAEYTLSFYAKASAPITVTSYLQGGPNAPPAGSYPVYIGEGAVVTSTTWTKYAYSFYLPSSQTDAAALFEFNLGVATAGTVVGLDGVALTPLDGAGNPLAAPTPPAANSYIRGANVQGGTQGLCCGSSVFANNSQLAWLAGKGLTHFREQFAWKLLQPTALGPLDSTYLGQMDAELQLAINNGEQIAFNPWDRENGQGQGGVPLNQLQDLWSKLIAHWAATPALLPGIWGYDLLNEPDSGANTLFANDAWNIQYVPALITTIRNAETAGGIATPKIIFAPTSTGGYGFYWSSHLTGLPFHDPANNLVYEAHFYFDKDAADNNCLNENGTYGSADSSTSSTACPDLNIGVKHVADFATWCSNQRVTCDVGEYGVPGGWNNTGQASCSGTGNAAVDSNFNTILSNFLTTLDTNNLWATVWEGGPFGDINDIGPTCDGSVRQQLGVITAHLSAGVALATPTPTITPGGPTLTPTPTSTPLPPTNTPTNTPTPGPPTATPTTVPAGSNLLSNPSFEGSLAPWTASGDVTDAGPAHTGTGAMSIADTNSDNGFLNIALAPNTTYTFGGFVYNANAGGLRYYDGAHTTTVMAPAATWTQFNDTFTTTSASSPNFALFGIAGAGRPSTDRTQVDDIYLVQGSAPVATNTPTATNTPLPATATNTATALPPTPTNTPTTAPGQPTNTPLPATATNTATATPAPPTATATTTSIIPTSVTASIGAGGVIESYSALVRQRGSFVITNGDTASHLLQFDHDQGDPLVGTMPHTLTPAGSLSIACNIFGTFTYHLDGRLAGYIVCVAPGMGLPTAVPYQP